MAAGAQEKIVLIAGGGPVGLFNALLLGRSGVRVRVFDNNAEIQEDPRAATTHPATLEVLAEAGMVDDMTKAGLVAPIFQFWDRPSNKLIAQFDHALLKSDTDFPYVVQCEQFKTSRLLLDRLRALPNVEVYFSHTVTDVSQDANSVTVEVESHGTKSRHRGSYLIGADGGRSVVRKQCGVDFEGFTYPERFLVLTTPFDFEKSRGFCTRTYIADPDEWCNCFKVAGDGSTGLWRTVFPTDPDSSIESIMGESAVQARLQKFFPTDTAYEVTHRNLYTTHQRVASTFRVGRVLLAGDSAHVNNSIGGMGLNGGLQDAANLADKLAHVIVNGASDGLLDLYSKQRRTVCIEFVQAQSIANKKRLETRDEATRAKNFAELSETAADPAKAREFLLGSSMISMQRRAQSITLGHDGV